MENFRQGTDQRSVLYLRGVAVDGDGNVIVANYQRDFIRKITPQRLGSYKDIHRFSGLTAFKASHLSLNLVTFTF